MTFIYTVIFLYVIFSSWIAFEYKKDSPEVSPFGCVIFGFSFPFMLAAAVGRAIAFTVAEMWENRGGG